MTVVTASRPMRPAPAALRAAADKLADSARILIGVRALSFVFGGVRARLHVPWPTLDDSMYVPPLCSRLRALSAGGRSPKGVAGLGTP